jgi:flagellar biogenesis protein FliO
LVLTVILFIVIIILFSCYTIKRIQKKADFEKKLSGSKDIKVNLTQFLDVKDLDFKIKLDEIKNISEIG